MAVTEGGTALRPSRPVPRPLDALVGLVPGLRVDAPGVLVSGCTLDSSVRSTDAYFLRAVSSTRFKLKRFTRRSMVTMW